MNSPNWLVVNESLKKLLEIISLQFEIPFPWLSKIIPVLEKDSFGNRAMFWTVISPLTRVTSKVSAKYPSLLYSILYVFALSMPVK